MIRVYLDIVLVIFISTFALELATLWATREVVGIKTRFLKMLIGSFCTAFSFIVFILCLSIMDVKPDIKIYIFAAVCFMCLSTVIAFGNVGFFRLVKLFFYRMIFTLLAGGTSGIVSSFTSGGRVSAYVSALMSVFIVSEVGWGAVHKGIKIGINQCINVNITFGRKSFQVPALVDTGNNLKDPISGYPALIVEFSSIKSILPDSICSFLEKNNGFYNVSNICEIISKSEWANRFRIIPFASLGNEEDVMIGFKPDCLTVKLGDEVLNTTKTVICIKSGHRPLSTTGDYKAILNPDVFKCLF